MDFFYYQVTIIIYIKEKEKTKENKIVTKYLQYNMIVNTHDGEFA